jgi:hypothetical protein
MTPCAPCGAGEKTVDPNLQFVMQSFLASMNLSFKAQVDHQVGLMARQGDYSALDNRLLSGALMQELFTTDDASKFAGFQAGSHVPIPQPWAGPMGGAAGASAGPGGKVA